MSGHFRTVSFEEFLVITGEKNAVELYREVPFSNFGYDRLVNLFHQYCLVGGLPDVVTRYAADRHIPGLTPLYKKHLEHYFSRAAAFSHTAATRERTLQIYQDAFVFAGTRIVFRGFGQSGYRSREVAQVFRHLESLSLVRLIYPTTAATLPWQTDLSRHPRIQLPDTGLVNYFTGIQDVLRNSDDLSAVFNRQISLHVVCQELLTGDFTHQGQVSFWVRNKTQSSAEIDFVIPYREWLIPIEVKPGEPGRLRSLHQFIDAAPHSYAIRLHAGPLSVQESTTIRGKTFYLMNLPYFLAGKIREHLEGFTRFVEGA